MGILLEADYKGVLQGRESPVAGLRRAFSGSKMGSSQNPLEKIQGEEGKEGRLEPGERDGQLTYELMNRDTGMSSIPPTSVSFTQNPLHPRRKPERVKC